MTLHRQVPCLDFKCDEELHDLLFLMNKLGVRTLLSCQANRGNQASRVRRVWVEVSLAGLHSLLCLLSRDDELKEVESLSRRMAPGDDPPDRYSYETDRVWHYNYRPCRMGGRLVDDRVSIRFPYTDLEEVTRRLMSIHASIGGELLPRP